MSKPGTMPLTVEYFFIALNAMIRPIKTVAVVFIFLCGMALTAAAGEKLSFKGKMVQSDREGITIMGEKDDGLLIVTNLKYHYALMLPYAEDWVFTTGNPELLKGNAGLVNLTLWVKKSGKTPTQYLETHKKWLMEPGRTKGLETIEIITHKNQPVLRDIVDGEKAAGSGNFRGVKIVNFFSAKKWGKYIYVLHLSRVVPPEEKKSFDEKKFLNMITAGFHVDFMRDEGKKE